MTSAVGSSWAVLALGGNAGEPLGAMRTAVAALAAVLDSLRVSAVYRTEPEGGVDQPWYLNAAVVGATRLSPREVLDLAVVLEAEAGRERPYPGAPRTLDVDVVFVGDAVVDEPGLHLPHPRWAEREFVVVPLMDIVPDFKDPETGRTVRDVAEAAGWHATKLRQEVAQGGLLPSERS